MTAAKQRQLVLEHVAGQVPTATGADCVQVAVDGVDGAGKTTFADELSRLLRAQGRDVVRVSVDDFHFPREIRYRRGKDSAEGFWLDSFDYARLASDVLDPLGPGGNRCYHRAAHDVASDARVDVPAETAPPGAVLVLDGLFLHRDGLAGRWALSIWLDAPFEVTAARMAARDGTPSDPAHPSMLRYVEAQRYYLSACDPMHRASLVIDNSVVERPLLVLPSI